MDEESEEADPQTLDGEHPPSEQTSHHPRGKGKEVMPNEQFVEEEHAKNKKHHLNLVFTGYDEAGRSTIGGQILLLSGQVDRQTIQKYEKEAKDKNRESWFMTYILDTNEDERLKGKTIEVSRVHFETESIKFTILDIPDHKSYVPNTISGASQADVGVLVISAQKEEFEVGYGEGGQTQEHIQFAKTLGVSKLVVVINKMDDPTVGWSRKRYDEVEAKMVLFLESSGFNVKKDVVFLPISGLAGLNINTRMDKKVCGWWIGPCLFDVLDSMESPLTLRMPIIDKYEDTETVVMGKIESGSIRVGDRLVVMPLLADLASSCYVKVLGIQCGENRVTEAGLGENVRVKLSGMAESDILSGFVLSSIAKPVPAVSEFEAELQILGLPAQATITVGYKAALYIHSVVEECEIVDLIEKIDKRGKNTDPKKRMRKPRSVKNGDVVKCCLQVNTLICIEKFSDFAQLGSVTLRTKGKEIAVGRVVGLPPTGSFRFA